MKKIIAIIITIFLVFAWGIRFYLVNKDVEKPNIQVFQKGITVPVEKDFFENSYNEDMDGYTFKILEASIMSSKDYFEYYHAEEQLNEDQLDEITRFTDYYYVVKVSIGNSGETFSDKKGISLGNCCLKGTTYILSLDETAFNVANPNMQGPAFSLNPNTEKEFIIPFTVISELTSYKSLQKDPPKLQISLFPTQKLLELY